MAHWLRHVVVCASLVSTVFPSQLRAGNWQEQLNDAPNLDAANVFWLHIQKTGTSMLNVLMTQFCNLPEEAELSNLACQHNEHVIPKFLDEFGSTCEATALNSSWHIKRLSHHTPLFADYYAESKGNIVMMMRQPEQRLLSLYDHHRSCGTKDKNLRQFAMSNSGGAALMIAGKQPHRDLVAADVERADVDRAKRRMNEGFAFIGITEEWNLSVCLFHAMFGGTCHPREFVNTRPHVGKDELTSHDVSDLEGYTDEIDGALYKEALAIFDSNLKKFNVTPSRCANDICDAVPDVF